MKTILIVLLLIGSLLCSCNDNPQVTKTTPENTKTMHLTYYIDQYNVIEVTSPFEYISYDNTYSNDTLILGNNGDSLKVCKQNIIKLNI